MSKTDHIATEPAANWQRLARRAAALYPHAPIADIRATIDRARALGMRLADLNGVGAGYGRFYGPGNAFYLTFADSVSGVGIWQVTAARARRFSYTPNA